MEDTPWVVAEDILDIEPFLGEDVEEASLHHHRVLVEVVEAVMMSFVVDIAWKEEEAGLDL